MNLRVLAKWVCRVITSTTWSPWIGYFTAIGEVWVVFWPDALRQRIPPSSHARRVDRTSWYTSTLQFAACGLLLGPQAEAALNHRHST